MLLQAAATLAALAAAEPGAASELLVQHLDGLQVSAKKLAELAPSEAATADKQLQIRWAAAEVSRDNYDNFNCCCNP